MVKLLPYIVLYGLHKYREVLFLFLQSEIVGKRQLIDSFTFKMMKKKFWEKKI
jgi:hypothetical protein